MDADQEHLRDSDEGGSVTTYSFVLSVLDMFEEDEGGLVSNPISGEAMRSTDLLSDYYDLFVGRKLKYNNIEIVDIDATTTIGDFLGEVNDLQPGRIVAWIEENVGDAGMSSRIIIIDKGNNPISVGWRDPSHEFLEEPTAFEVSDLGFGHDARFQGVAPANTTFGTSW